MSGKDRRVYFYEPFFVDDNGDNHDAPNDFWKLLMDHVQDLSPLDRTKRIYGSRYRGAARSTESTAERFLYVGKRRPRQDWPDTSVDGADEQPLDMDGELVEPMYLLPVGQDNYIATMRSSGGPTFAAAVEWIGQVLQSQGHEMAFQMRSVVRYDALKRLGDSAGVVMFDLKLGAGADIPAGAGAISTAVRDLQNQGGADMSIGVRLSFGNVVPDSATARELARDVEKVIRGGHGVKKAVAKILETSEEGSFSKEELSFIQDRITHKVSVGTSESEAQTAEVVIAAMTDATQNFRRNLPSILNGSAGDDGEEAPTYDDEDDD